MRSEAILVVIGLLAGAAGGAGVSALSSPSKAEAKKKDKATAEEPGEDETDDADLEEGADGDAKDREIASLRLRVARLESQLSVVKKGLTLYRNAGGEAATADGGTVDLSNLSSEDPVFRLAVRDVVDKIEEERQQERQTRRDQWRQQRTSAMIEAIGKKVALSSAEEQKIREILEKRQERFRELRNSDAGAPRTRNEWRDRMRKMREDTNADLERELSGPAAAAAKEVMQEEGGGWGRRGGGRRGGGGG